MSRLANKTTYPSAKSKTAYPSAKIKAPKAKAKAKARGKIKTSMDKINDRLIRSTHLNFSRKMSLEATIETIGPNFFVGTDANHKMRCEPRFGMGSLEQGQRIRMEAHLRCNGPNQIYLDVESYHLVDMEKIYNDKRILYQKLQTTMNLDKYQKILKKVKVEVDGPSTACNIGLIVCPGDDHNIQNFKISFGERCMGKLYVYHLSYRMLLSHAMEYFRKYHDIDMVCLLTNNLTPDQIYDLSSKHNVKYLLTRKQYPFLVSILGSNPIHPLTSILSNKTIVGINPCIDFISGMQLAFKNDITRHSKTSQIIALNIIEKYRRQVVGLRTLITELNDGRAMVSPFDKIKEILIKKLAKERNFLYKIQIMIMKKIMDDPRMQHIYQGLINMENKVIESIENKKIENKTADNDSNPNQTTLEENGEF